MRKFVTSENALVRYEDAADEPSLPQVWWPDVGEWHYLPELEAVVEGAPITREDAATRFPGVDLDAEVQLG